MRRGLSALALLPVWRRPTSRINRACRAVVFPKSPGRSRACRLPRLSYRRRLTEVVFLQGVIAWLGAPGLAGAECIDYGQYLHWVAGGVPATGCYALTVGGDLVYAVNATDGLHVVDVSIPDRPREIGHLPLGTSPHDVALTGTRLVVVEQFGPSEIVDVSDPTAPTLLGTLPTPAFAWGAAVSGDLAYVANGPYGLYIIDLSDPTAPLIMASLALPGNAYDVALRPPYAYVAS